MKINNLHRTIILVCGFVLLNFTVIAQNSISSSGSITSDYTYTGNTTITSNATYTVQEGAVLTIKGNLTINSGATLIVKGVLKVTGTVTNMGTIKVLDDGQKTIAQVNIDKDFVNGNTTDNMSTQGTVILKNAGFAVAGTYFIGSDSKQLTNQGMIVQGEKDSYIVVNTMQRGGHKNWLTKSGEGDLYIVSNTNIVQGSAEMAYNNNSYKKMPWNYVINPSGGDCTNDFFDANYNYYKLNDVSGFGSNTPLKKSTCVYLQVPTDIHLYSSIWAGQEKFIKSGIQKEFITEKREEIKKILPIELTYFNVAQYGDNLYFEWETDSEYNNDYFTIEYSYNGANFYNLTTKEGNGTTSEVNHYEVSVKKENLEGIVYFRLKQTDFNAEYSYSNIEILNIVAQSSLFVHPNPTNDIITISVDFTNVEFRNSKGQIVSVPRLGNKQFNVYHLPTGIYYVIIDGKVVSFIKK